MIKNLIRKYIFHGEEFQTIFNLLEEIRIQLNRIEEEQKRLRTVIDDINSVQIGIQTMTKEFAKISMDKAGSCEYLIQLFMGNWQLETMSRYEDASDYKIARHILGLHSLLKVKKLKTDSGNLCRVGKFDDGGYVMSTDFVENKVAYSFGISDDVSWDEFMAEHGFDVYMYDHTIESLPECRDRFHWKKIGLAGTYDEERPELHTLPMILEENGHLETKHMILKMDIEGAEWDCFGELENKYLKQFDQIILEFHNMNDLSKYRVMEHVLSKLNESHQLVHIHGNNCVKYTMVMGKVMPDVVECTYLKKDMYEFVDNDQVFPNELDYANNADWPDIYLGKWK